MSERDVELLEQGHETEEESGLTPVDSEESNQLAREIQCRTSGQSNLPSFELIATAVIAGVVAGLAKPIEKVTSSSSAALANPSDNQTSSRHGDGPAQKPGEKSVVGKPAVEEKAIETSADKPAPAKAEVAAKPAEKVAAPADKPMPIDKPAEAQPQAKPVEWERARAALRKALETGSADNIQGALRQARQHLDPVKLRSTIQDFFPNAQIQEVNGQIQDITIDGVRYRPDGSTVIRDSYNERDIRRANDGTYHVTGPDGVERPYVLAEGCNHHPESNSLSNGMVGNATGRPILVFGNGPAHEGNSKGDSFVRVLPPGMSRQSSDYDGIVTDARYQPVMLPNGQVLMPRHVHPDAQVVKINDVTLGMVNRNQQGQLSVTAHGLFGSATPTTMREFTGGRYSTPQYGNNPVPEIRVPRPGERP